MSITTQNNEYERDRSLGTWGEKQRLGFIERVLYWRGWVNRRDLCERFWISPPQATNDLTTYSTLNPEGCRYNVRTRRYESGAQMETVLVEPDMQRDFDFMGAGVLPSAERAFVAYPEVPVRVSDRGLLRVLVRAAYRKECLEVNYFSVHSGEVSSRTISPRAFAQDGLRWHVRAFCHRDEVFKDFVVGRMSEAAAKRECPYAEVVDEDWEQMIYLHFRPNPDLPEASRRALEMDYGMREGVLRVGVRRAMKIYTCRRLGFVGEETDLPLLNETKQLEWFAVSEEED